MLRIEIYQQNACFRIPQMGNPILTFPLSPPSTVFGLLRYITCYQSINKDNTKIAISGIYESKLRHIITNHITGISDEGKYKSNIIPTEELFNVKHIVHIESKEKNLEKEIAKNIFKATRFGRQEDIILRIEFSNTEENKIDWLNIDYEQIKNLDYYLYVPFNNFSSLNALSIFSVPLDSDKDLLDQNYLKFNFTKLLFLRVQHLITNCMNKEKLLLDKDGYLYVWIN